MAAYYLGEVFITGAELFSFPPQVLGGAAGAYLGRREALVLLALQLAGRLGLSDQVHMWISSYNSLCCSGDISRIGLSSVMMRFGSLQTGHSRVRLCLRHMLGCSGSSNTHVCALH